MSGIDRLFLKQSAVGNWVNRGVTGIKHIPAALPIPEESEDNAMQPIIEQKEHSDLPLVNPTPPLGPQPKSFRSVALTAIQPPC